MVTSLIQIFVLFLYRFFQIFQLILFLSPISSSPIYALPVEWSIAQSFLTFSQLSSVPSEIKCKLLIWSARLSVIYTLLVAPTPISWYFFNTRYMPQLRLNCWLSPNCPYCLCLKRQPKHFLLEVSIHPHRFDQFLLHFKILLWAFLLHTTSFTPYNK